MRVVFAAVLVLACGPSAEERQAAEAARREAMRNQILWGMENRVMRDAGARCSESPDHFAALLLRHPEFVAPLEGKPFVNLSFVSSVGRAAARHDSTKSCAALVDSVARALGRQDAHTGSR